jgi:hypothetical protein
MSGIVKSLTRTLTLTTLSTVTASRSNAETLASVCRSSLPRNARLSGWLALCLPVLLTETRSVFLSRI